MITHTDIGYNGRFGNQLFIYALLYKLKTLGKEVFIPAYNIKSIKDDGCFDTYHKFWIKYRCVLYDYFNLSMPLKDKYDALPKWQEMEVKFYPKVLQLDNVNLSGYFQSWKYFDDIKEDLLKELKFKSEITDKIDKFYKESFEYKTIGIQIRLGDTLGQSWMHKLSIEYISEVLQMFPEDNYNFLIFSDNIDYCKDWFGDDDRVYFEKNLNEAESLYMLSLCDNLILSASTYSWWAAYLNQKNGLKIFPDYFDGSNRDLDGFYHPSWKRIKVEVK